MRVHTCSLHSHPQLLLFCALASSCLIFPFADLLETTGVSARFIYFSEKFSGLKI